METTEILQVVGTPRVDGSDLLIEVESGDREALTSKGRQFVMEWVGTHEKYSSWATAGIDRASGPITFDPSQPDKDPYEIIAKTPKEKQAEIKWHFRQLFKLTRMI